jgi:flagellin
MAVINTNYLSLVAQNNLTKSQSSLGSAIERLSSGLRINSAADDAAGQAIANRFTANVTGLTQASRNANDGISLAQTTQGALDEINNNLQRVRELTVQAVNGTNSSSDLTSIQAEITQRLSEIDRVSAQTQFNGVSVLAKSQTLNIQVGANDGENIGIDLKEITSKTLGLTGFNVDGNGTANTKAASTDLLVAGFTAGATTNGVTQYSRTLTQAANGAKSADYLSTMQNGGTVVSGTATYTYNSTTKDYSASDTARTAAATATSLTPASGSVTATVTIGGKTSNISISSTGAITDAADGSTLYLDASKNLTKTGTGAVTVATVASLTAVATGMQSGDKLVIGSTGASYTSAGATFAVTGEKATAAAVSAIAATTGSKIDIDGAGASAQVTVAAGDSITGSFVGLDGITTTAAENVNLNANGVVTSAAGSIVYADSSSAGKLTTKAVSNATSTVDPLAALDSALAQVDSMRSDLGAVQNRFQSAVANLNNTVVNLSAARSRIEDADYATEVSNMGRAQILQQAGTSVLAQANQVPQTVLTLLR